MVYTSNEAMELVREHDFERRRRTADFFVMKKGDLTVFVPRDAEMDDKAWAQLLQKAELLVIAFRESLRRIESRERHPTLGEIENLGRGERHRIVF